MRLIVRLILGTLLFPLLFIAFVLYAVSHWAYGNDFELDIHEIIRVCYHTDE